MMNTPAYGSDGNLITVRPLAGYANQMMGDAVANNVDPRLLVSIAFVEGKWGGEPDALAKDNSFGLHNSAGKLADFTTIGGWAANVEAASEVVAQHIDVGQTSVGLLYSGKNGAYCVGASCAARGTIVGNRLVAQGGSTDTITSSCYQDGGSYYKK